MMGVAVFLQVQVKYESRLMEYVSTVRGLVVCVVLLLAYSRCTTGTLTHAGLSTKRLMRVQAVSHTPIADIELIPQRHKRATSFSPVTLNRTVFQNDNHVYGQVQYMGDGSKVLFVLTYSLSNNRPTSSTLYRSTDYGLTFTNITSSLTPQDTAPHVLYPAIHISPSKKLVVFVDDQRPQIYISRDDGKTFTTQTLNNTLNSRTILFHPVLDYYFLIRDQSYSLYVTSDLGQNVVKISDNVLPGRYQWGVVPYDDTTSVYYNVFDPNDVNRGNYTVQLYTQRAPYGTAQMTEFDPSIGKHDDFLIVDRYMFLQKTVSNVVSLWVSYDRQPFLMAKIPSDVPHQNYLVDSIKSLQALVIVEHTSGQFNLYLSEETGQHFSLSLPDIVIVKAKSAIDLELVDSMNATYIANQNVNSAAGTVRTLISFDNGGNWQTLTPPDSAQCQPPSCSLHLHMSTTEYWRTGVYSQGSAPGIIIAHGTTGPSLSSNPDLYLSRDGGATWMRTLQSTWGVTVLDHGGLIVAAKDYHQTDRSAILKYSCDEGTSWTDFTFSQIDITIFGVVTEPGETTTIVSLYGVEHFNPVEWTVLVINFTTVFTSGQCQLDDYYWWEPSTGCLLGSAVSIQRRKPTVCCLNSQQYNRAVNYTVCACVPEDFECDYGYMHSNGLTGSCVIDPAVSLPAVCQGDSTHYSQSKGYRKIGGDVCTGGKESTLAVVDTPCCSNSTSQPTCPPCSCPTCNTSCSPCSTSCPPCSTSCPSCPTSCPPCSTSCPSCPTSCPPCSSPSSSSNTPTSYTHVTGGVVGTPTNPVTVVLAVVVVIAVIIIVALLTVNVVLLWRLTRKTPNNGYQNVPTTERFVYHPNQSETVHTNLTAYHDDDDEAPLQP